MSRGSYWAFRDLRCEVDPLEKMDELLEGGMDS